LETPSGRGRHHLQVGFSLARAGGRCPLPLGASMAAHSEEIVFVSECAYLPCSIVWAICRCCYRGHRYCSDACSERARREKKREYNRRRQQGPGRDHHRERQRACRLRQAKRTSSKQIVTDHSSTEPPSDGTLVGARRQQVVRSAKPSTRAAQASQDGSVSCRRCGRHSVLVEPLSERKRIVALVRGRQRCQPRSAQSGESSTMRPPFADYMGIWTFGLFPRWAASPAVSRIVRERMSRLRGPPTGSGSTLARSEMAAFDCFGYRKRAARPNL